MKAIFINKTNVAGIDKIIDSLILKRRKVNRITAKCVKGIYKDKEVEIQIGNTHKDTIVKINGKQIPLIQSIHIKMKFNCQTVITIEKLKN